MENLSKKLREIPEAWKARVLGIVFTLCFTLLLSRLDDLSDLIALIFLATGPFILLYSFFPESKLGKLGKLFYDTARYLKSERKQRKEIAKKNLSADQLDEVMPYAVVKGAVSPYFDKITNSAIIKKLFKSLTKPLLLLAFFLSAFSRLLLDRLFIVFLAAFLGPFIFYQGADKLLGISNDALNFTLPFVNIKIYGMSYIFSLFMLSPILLYAYFLWQTCKVGHEEEAKIVGIVKWPANTRWNPDFVEYSYLYDGELHESVLPPSEILMNAYGRTDTEKAKVKETERIDKRNLAESVTVLVNESFPAVNCLKYGACNTLFQLFYGRSVKEVYDEVEDIIPTVTSKTDKEIAEDLVDDIFDGIEELRKQ